MITQFNDFSLNQPEKDDQEKIDIFFDEWLYPRRIFVFENYWCNSLFDEFNNQSVKPFIKNIGNLIGKNVSFSHRFVDSKQSLSYYLKEPGVVWDSPESLQTGLWYFGFHGRRDGIEFPNQLISKNDLLDIITGFDGFPNILFFSSCELFRDKDFGFELLKKSGSRGILGFKKKVGWGIGTIIDLLFLFTFFNYEGDPFKDIEVIYNSVIQEFPYSRQVGFTLFH